MAMANHPSCRVVSSDSITLVREAMIMVSFASQILTAAATLLSFGVTAASDGNGNGNGNATLTLCVNVDGRHSNPDSPFYGAFGYSISQGVEATNASDRSSSVMYHSRRSLTVTVGPDHEDEYALAQCRPDVSADECSRYLNACLGAINNLCDSAAVRYDVCLLRYGTQDFSSFDVNEYAVTVFDGSKSSLRKEVPYGLLSRVAANATANGSRTAAGISDYPDTAAGGARASVYGLAQCVTQIPAPDCDRCLRDALFRLSSEFNSSAGMQVLRPSCLVRYDSSLFFNKSLLPVTHVSVPDGQGAVPPAGCTPLPHGRSARAIALSAGLGGGAAALAVAALVTLWFMRRSRKSKSSQTLICAGGGNYSYQTLVDATGNFSEENQLGSGGCGVVDKGILENMQEIAVKKLARKELKELEREVSLVADLQHENLVKFLGHCYQEGEMFLVYEYLRNKCLSNYFKSSADREKLDWPKWLNIIKGIARGLSYLHRDSGKDIVHRDLKPSNVLLDSNFAAKNRRL